MAGLWPAVLTPSQYATVVHDPAKGRLPRAVQPSMLLISGVVFSLIVWAVLWFVERDRHIPFTTALGLGFGIKLASFAIVLVLGAILGPFILAPVFFAAWAILCRYGRLSERHQGRRVHRRSIAAARTRARPRTGTFG